MKNKSFDRFFSRFLKKTVKETDHEIKHTGGKMDNSLWQFNHNLINCEAKSAVSKGSLGEDAELVDRLIHSYNNRVNKPSGMWKNFFSDKHKDIHDTLLSKDRQKVQQILRTPNTTDILYGFDSNAKSLLGNAEKPSKDPRTLDALISLSEAIGGRRLFNPVSKSCIQANIEELIVEIENKFGIDIEFPNIFPDDFGLNSTRGIIHYRAALALYQAWRVNKISLQFYGRPSILEIGGGLGRAAFYTYKFGIKDYTIVDIPITSIAQGYFLGRTLGEEKIFLSGEEMNEQNSEKIKLISPEQLFKEEKKFDLIVNFDGLTEYGKTDIDQYWDFIKKQTKCFLSVNHEMNQFTVFDLAKGDSSVINFERFPFWLRRGYDEEIISF